MSTYLTLAEATERVPVSAMTIRRAIKSGNLTAFKVAGKLLIRPDDLEAWVEAGRVGTQPIPRPNGSENRLVDRALSQRKGAA